MWWLTLVLSILMYMGFNAQKDKKKVTRHRETIDLSIKLPITSFLSGSSSHKTPQLKLKIFYVGIPPEEECEKWIKVAERQREKGVQLFSKIKNKLIKILNESSEEQLLEVIELTTSDMMSVIGGYIRSKEVLYGIMFDIFCFLIDFIFHFFALEHSTGQKFIQQVLQKF